MTRTLRTPGDLVAAGLVAPGEVGALAPVAERYAVAVPPAFAALIDADDPDDPIALQVVPRAAELDRLPEDLSDPIGDAAHSPVPGIVHRYPDRALLTLLHVCPLYCRFCFRRERVGPGADAVLPPAVVETALAYLAENRGIWEVILTGGDPLALAPRRIAAVMERLRRMSHVKVVRFHTRVPVAAPDLVTPELVSALAASGKSTYLAVHSNHPRELTAAARDAIGRIAGRGIALLSQTVLLRGVNDDAEVLADLMRAFVELQVRPYYLHQCDRAPGTAHLRVPLDEARRLVARLRGRISGLCQPTFVLDIPGGHGKVPIGPDYLDPEAGTVEDPWGRTHPYRD